MNKILLTFTFLFIGCTINSISPSGGGLEMDMDLDLSLSNMRHGWAYFSRPNNTEVYVRDEDSVNRGKNLFLQHCQKCHGEKGIGDGPLAQALKLKPANLTKLAKGTNTSYILVQINDGKGSMPQWKDFLTQKQMIDVTHYIQDLSFKEAGRSK